MENYRSGSHSRFDIKYHFVWVTKDSKSNLMRAGGTHICDLVRGLCRTHEIPILQGADHPDNKAKQQQSNWKTDARLSEIRLKVVGG